MLKILAVCGAGLGSSFACQMSAEAVLKDLGVDAKMDHTDISSVSGHRQTSSSPQRISKSSLSVIRSAAPTVFLERLVDKNEIREKLVPVLKELGELLKTRGKRKSRKNYASIEFYHQ